MPPCHPGLTPAGADRAARAGRDGWSPVRWRGTSFLDEIAELSMAQQSGLLRVPETRHIRLLGSEQEIAVDGRTIAASNRPLCDAAEAGRVRKGLC